MAKDTKTTEVTPVSTTVATAQNTTTPTTARRSAESTAQAQQTRLAREAMVPAILANTEAGNLKLADGRTVDLAVLAGPTMVNLVEKERTKPRVVDTIIEKTSGLSDTEKAELIRSLGGVAPGDSIDAPQENYNTNPDPAV